MKDPSVLYIGTFFMAMILGLLLTPLMRRLALHWGIMDHPSSPVKTHRIPTPYLGGVAIALSVTTTLFLIRFFTHFPTGTLRALRGLLVGSGFMVVVGVIDDIKAGGLAFYWKFLFQFFGALILIYFDIRIKFIQPIWLAELLTILWVVGITNAFNIIDIMDGLSSSQAFVASLGFLFISLPTEEIYVNFAAASLAGACLAFFPFNISDDKKIFMGDAGSLFLGFLLAALALGTSYSHMNEVGLFAPLLILGLPLYDTLFVSFMRLKQGKSPFLGSKDHLALKLRTIGLSPHMVVFFLALVAVLFSAAAYFVTWSPISVAIFVVVLALSLGIYGVIKLNDIHVP